MPDFIGVIPLNGQDITDIQEPFRYLNDFQEIKSDVKHLKVDGSYFLGRGSGTHSDTFCNDLIFAIQHGDCYVRIENTTLNKTGKLTVNETVELYQQYGNDFVNHIKGSFAISIIERKEKTVKVFSDPLNLRSIYYVTSGSELVISSSLTTLANYLRQSGKTLQVYPRAIADRILFDFVLDNHTYIEGVKEVPPGSLLQLNDQRISISQYFDPFRFFDLSGPTLDYTEGSNQLKDILTKNIEMYSEGPKMTAVALTGGFDSRSIAALLGSDLPSYQVYSYGKKASWDMKIPKAIAKQLDLNYVPILLDDSYESKFGHFADLAVVLGDGITEFSQANISYAYSRYLGDRTSILTGLFGSELIKTPSSRGLFIDANVINLLNSNNLPVTLRSILRDSKEQGYNLDRFFDELIEMVQQHPYINNDLPINKKYFYYLLMVGARKYFSKEVKIQKVLKQNLHPFFDLDFISTLLKTPFPWVHNFSRKKDLVKNVSIHQLYARFIQSDPILSNAMSTHGFRPKYLLNKWQLPLLAIEYFIYKKKIRKTSQLDFQHNLAIEYIYKNNDRIINNDNLFKKLLTNGQKNEKNFLKLSSLHYWLKTLDLSLGDFALN